MFGCISELWHSLYICVGFYILGTAGAKMEVNKTLALRKHTILEIGNKISTCSIVKSVMAEVKWSFSESINKGTLNFE